MREQESACVEERERERDLSIYLTRMDIMTGRPNESSFVDSIRIAVKLMVIRTTPPRNEAAPIRA